MPTQGIAGEIEHDWTMRRFTFAGTCLLTVVLAISGHTVFGQSQQRGGSSSSSSNSYGNSSSSYGSSSNSRSTSSNSYGTSSSSYGSSRNSYRTSRNTYRTSRRTYGSSSGGQSRRSSSTSQRRVRGLKERSERRLYLPIILAGIVIIEGGARPPEPVVVWINCGGQALPQAYTDRRGRFSFQPGCNPVPAMSDASVRSAFFGGPAGNPLGAGRGGVSLSDCWLYAELPGYQSSRLWLGMWRPMSRNNVGTIVLSPIKGASGASVSFTTLTASTRARKAYEKGAKALRSVDEPDYATAIPLLERALELHPEFAAAWEALGRARQGLGETASAREAFERSVDLDDRFLKPYLPLIEMAVAEKDWSELESLTDRYLAISPGSMKLRLYNSFGALKTGKFSKAETMAKMIGNAGEMDNWPMSYLILAEVRSRRGEFNEAAKLYKTYLRTLPNGQYSEVVKRMLYDWSELQVIDPADVGLPAAPHPERMPIASSASAAVAP
ncbi:MAG: tetratricopeptide repeat protein [Acidobacteriia bacterium]|nr:tetratricopeptide repeat protein [Terriglobia bacterium]